MSIWFVILCALTIGLTFMVGLWFGYSFADDLVDEETYHLSAEIEHLNDALDALAESYEQSVEYGNKIFDALQRSVDAYEEMKKFKSQKYKSISPEIQNKIRDAWRQASE